MISQYNTLAFTLGTASLLIVAVLAANKPELIQRNQDGNILNIIARSGDIMQRSPGLFMDCLNKFLVASNNLAANLTKYHDICCDDADTKISQVDAESSGGRNDLTHRAETSCNLVQECQNASSVGKQYGCLTSRTSDNAIFMRTASSEASSQFAEYLEKLHVINNGKERCINATLETFEVATVNEHIEFDNCCYGRGQTTPPL